MAKPRLEVIMQSYGLYSPHKPGKEVPSIQKFTTEIPVALGVEFGYVLRVKKGHGKIIRFQIDHPPFKDESGKKVTSFTGEQHVRGNDFKFFLGDTFWEPLDDKRGNWTLSAWIGNKLVAEKTLSMV